MSPTLTFARYTHPGEATHLLTDIYRQVYADRLTDSFFSVARFADRLTQHAAGPRWEAVIGYAGPDPVGYAYGAGRPAGTGYWATVTPPPDPAFAAEDGQRTFVLFEFMILPAWRKSGASRAVHDELLAGRDEHRVTLAVEHEHPRVRALYESWGYQFVGQRTPTVDSPVMDILWRHLETRLEPQ